jgi:hypothetical protein
MFLLVLRLCTTGNCLRMLPRYVHPPLALCFIVKIKLWVLDSCIRNIQNALSLKDVLLVVHEGYLLSLPFWLLIWEVHHLERRINLYCYISHCLDTIRNNCHFDYTLCVCLLALHSLQRLIVTEQRIIDAGSSKRQVMSVNFRWLVIVP